MTSSLLPDRLRLTAKHDCDDLLQWLTFTRADMNLTLPTDPRARRGQNSETAQIQLAAASCFLQLLFDRNKWAVVTASREKDPSHAAIDDNFVTADLHAETQRSMLTASFTSTNIISDQSEMDLDLDLLVGHDEYHQFSVDPNIGNLFGNLPLSSAIRANHFPEHIQSY